MLDQNFCSRLEFYLTKAFSYSKDNQLKGFWCDGILLPFSDIEISKKYIRDKKEIDMTAFIGKDGQETYQLKLLFGKKSLKKYEMDLNLEDCIPPEDDDNWYEADIINKTLTIQLL